MGSLAGRVTPEKVDAQHFGELLKEYKPLMGSISTAKGAKPGQKTLEELDVFRYSEAPKLFSQSSPQRPMNHDDLITLVDWKLRHGKFRPTLMKLVTSNDSSLVQKTIAEGLKTYQKDADVSKTLGVLTKLKGIGPATASLVLAVHYPDDVPFFSDESYYWLCNGSKKESLKYSMKEYEALISEARTLMQRLEVTAMDLEKVSYVVMKSESDAPATAMAKEPVGATQAKAKVPKARTAKVLVGAKRTATANDDGVSLRRSKRGKTT